MTGAAGPLLAFDTATTTVVAVLGRMDGSLLGETSWEAGYRHGESLLPSISSLLDEQDVARSSLAGIIVGTGPGAFTGLRVGLATAKGLAHGLGVPIVGVSTAEALLAAATRPSGVAIDRLVLLLPAGPSDRIAVRAGRAPDLLPGGVEPAAELGDRLVAVDLGGRAPAEAVALGERARAGLGTELLRLGAERLAAGRADPIDRLVPEYVTLPRGVRATGGEVAWSRDPR